MIFLGSTEMFSIFVFGWSPAPGPGSLPQGRGWLCSAVWKMFLIASLAAISSAISRVSP